MAAIRALLALAAAQAVNAHYGLLFPEWRADTLNAEDDSELSQWTYPCAGAEFGDGNFTDWPLDGGALSVELGHHWTYLFVNLGLGNGTTDFNITLTPDLTNVTSSGTLCIDKLNITGEDIQSGTFGTLQVITLDGSGSSLYNCADIRFTDDAEGPEDCQSSEGMNVEYITGEAGSHEDHGDSDNSSDSSDSESSDDDSAAGVLNVGMTTLVSAISFSAALLLGF